MRLVPSKINLVKCLYALHCLCQQKVAQDCQQFQKGLGTYFHGPLQNKSLSFPFVLAENFYDYHLILVVTCNFSQVKLSNNIAKMQFYIA